MFPLVEQQEPTVTSPAGTQGRAAYRTCGRCVMDTTHADVYFDDTGVCNYCRGFDVAVASKRESDLSRQEQFARSLAEIKAAGQGREYDCVLGVSGGVDSSYVALKCKDWGLRPLLVQFDNGWNTELANHNIQRLCDVLGFDLYTYVVDWSEFRDLQLSFLQAGVANLEIPSDHGIFACIYNIAATKDIRWLLTGVNLATEASSPLRRKGMPRQSSYGYRYTDLVHLKAVHRRFGKRKLVTFPTLGFLRREWLERTGQVRRFDPLNFVAYVKASAVNELQRRVGWKPYTGKHFESVITRFHQTYILPVKFSVDKRKLHLSGLIWSGQLTRDQALEELAKPPCPPALLAQDRDFFLKKLQLSAEDFERIMSAEPKNSLDYPNINWVYESYARFVECAARVARSVRFRDTPPLLR